MTTPTALHIIPSKEGAEIRLYYSGKKPTPKQAKGMARPLLSLALSFLDKAVVAGVQSENMMRERGVATLCLEKEGK